jgi:hypothetical protein
MYDPHGEVSDWPSGRSVDADALPDSAAIAETPRWWTGQYDNQSGIWLFKDGAWTLLYSDRDRYGGGVSSSTPAASEHDGTLEEDPLHKKDLWAQGQRQETSTWTWDNAGRQSEYTRPQK